MGNDPSLMRVGYRYNSKIKKEYISDLNAFQGGFPKKTGFDVPASRFFSRIIADTV